ncbi:MAG: GNAT family N-acetyltransferase [Rhodothermus sp.]|nr:GNAT family N-acetyltransferase [Rhodothermus sp.]
MSEAVFHIHPVRNEAEWARARAIRERVFIQEQGCSPEEEWDGYDEVSRHFLGWVGDVPVATARWRVVPFNERLVAKLERFAVLPEYRGYGYGRAMVQYVMEDARRAGFSTLLIHAQAHLERFYEGLGFRSTGARFMEAGIPHVQMIWQQ